MRNVCHGLALFFVCTIYSRLLGNTTVESALPVKLVIHLLLSLEIHLVHIDAAQDLSRLPPELPKVGLPFAIQELEAPGWRRAQSSSSTMERAESWPPQAYHSSTQLCR